MLRYYRRDSITVKDHCERSLYVYVVGCIFWLLTLYCPIAHNNSSLRFLSDFRRFTLSSPSNLPRLSLDFPSALPQLSLGSPSALPRLSFGSPSTLPHKLSASDLWPPTTTRILRILNWHEVATVHGSLVSNRNSKKQNIFCLYNQELTIQIKYTIYFFCEIIIAFDDWVFNTHMLINKGIC